MRIFFLTQINKKVLSRYGKGQQYCMKSFIDDPPPPISSNFLVVGTHLPCQLWNAQDFRRSQQIQHALQLLRGVVSGGTMAPPDFGRSVNPISTIKSRSCSPNNTGTPGFSDLPTALNYRVWDAILAIMDAWYVNSKSRELKFTCRKRYEF